MTDRVAEDEAPLATGPGCNESYQLRQDANWTRWEFVEDLYRRPTPTGKWRYYDGMLYMMAMLHVSGNFRVYSPESPPGEAAN